MSRRPRVPRPRCRHRSHAMRAVPGSWRAPARPGRRCRPGSAAAQSRGWDCVYHSCLYSVPVSYHRVKPGGATMAAKPTAGDLASLSNWAPDAAGKSINRELKFKDFNEAWGFMNRVALLAESQDHHPNWSNVWNTVNITLSTHDAGGLTDKDITLARAIDALLS